MDITQLLITVGAVVGIALIGLLAVIPSLLDFPTRTERKAAPRGRDQDGPDLPATKPPTRRRHRHSDVDLAA